MIVQFEFDLAAEPDIELRCMILGNVLVQVWGTCILLHTVDSRTCTATRMQLWI